LAGVSEIADQIRERMEHYLIGLRNEQRRQGVNAQFVIVDGISPAASVCDFVQGEGIDMIVMSTHGRGRLARFLFGSVAQKVIQSVRIPVMLIRPDEAEGEEIEQPTAVG
ncbi:MAG: universal stress protein, partial [Anaerolineae bacterium]|nr:universal stress protein [Anaerolineae bacterium]